MYVVQPKRTVQKREVVISEFLGFNNTDNISQSEFLAMQNMSSRHFPALAPRLSREVIGTLAIPNGAYSFNGALYTVDGTNFKKDGVTKGTVTNGRKCMLEFNQNILIFPDLKYYDTVGNTFGSFANGTINPIANPAILKATVHFNRVIGYNGVNVYSSKQGDFKEFNVFAGLNTDSWASDVAGALPFNTIGTYQNHVVLQSAEKMFELYGYKPSNFTLQESGKMGSKVYAYQEVAGALFFGNKEGIYAFTGGQPRKISRSIAMAFTDIELGGDTRYLYINASDGTNMHLFVYDTETNIMSREDDINVLHFFNHNEYVHALLANGQIVRFGTGNEVVEWSVTTSEFSDFRFSNNAVKNVEINAEMATNSQMDIYVKADNDATFWHVKSFTAEQNRTLLIPIIMYKNAYSIRIDGKGFVKINAIKRTVQEGGAV